MYSHKISVLVLINTFMHVLLKTVFLVSGCEYNVKLSSVVILPVLIIYFFYFNSPNTSDGPVAAAVEPDAGRWWRPWYGRVICPEA